MKITDDELVDMQARALRVLGNGTTSGSARRMASDCLRMSATLLARSHTYKLRKSRDERIARQKEAFAALGIAWENVNWDELDDRELLDN